MFDRIFWFLQYWTRERFFDLTGGGYSRTRADRERTGRAAWHHRPPSPAADLGGAASRGDGRQQPPADSGHQPFFRVAKPGHSARPSPRAGAQAGPACLLLAVRAGVCGMASCRAAISGNGHRAASGRDSLGGRGGAAAVDEAGRPVLALDQAVNFPFAEAQSACQALDGLHARQTLLLLKPGELAADVLGLRGRGEVA